MSTTRDAVDAAQPRVARPVRPAGALDPRALRIGKVVLFVACLGPLARLLVYGFTDRLGANPVEFVTRSLGTWTLVMLCLTLAITPLRKLTGLVVLARYRRMLGLYAFFYGCLHLTTYLWFDQWFEWGEIVRDVIKRPFITVGMAAFLLMVPLAVTSTNAMMRRLGRRWQTLHRLVYAVAVLGVLHFWWHKAGKNALGEPMLYATIVGGLLLLRIVLRWQAAAASRAAPAAKVAVRVPRP